MSCRIHLDGTVTVANLVENGAKTNANAQVNTQTHPVVSYVPVHIHKWPSGEHKELCWEAGLFPLPKWSSTLECSSRILEQEFDLECVNIARSAPCTPRWEVCCRFIQMKSDMLYRCWISMLLPPVKKRIFLRWCWTMRTLTASMFWIFRLEIICISRKIFPACYNFTGYCSIYTHILYYNKNKWPKLHFEGRVNV